MAAVERVAVVRAAIPVMVAAVWAVLAARVAAGLVEG
jgi:hypothetical protein